MRHIRTYLWGSPWYLISGCVSILHWQMLTTSVGGVPPADDKLFVICWGGNAFVVLLPVPTIPDCNVHFKLFEAICDPFFVGQAAGLCSPTQWMHLFLTLEN